MGERLREVFKNPTGLIIMVIVMTRDICQPWVAGILFAAIGLICWPATKVSEARLWLRRTDGRIHTIDYFALIAVLASLAAVSIRVTQSLDVECSGTDRRSRHRSPTCQRSWRR